ncbi:hypothetical protein Cgig2_019529 [Carnegiea gigantea]|uniref:Uncharacterized protein n=1 Tax=Carnegiea gigantea TaxID=171969 RepID=A0A9Q1KHI7_9CARY|nr:hypothetical protein Cgig2_019529 [Carnegiea gigantea]
MQLLYSPHNTPLCNLVHDHGVEDRLHHLEDIGVLCIPCSHAKVETRIEDKGRKQAGIHYPSRGIYQPVHHRHVALMSRNPIHENNKNKMISNKGEELSTPGRKGGSVLLSTFVIIHTPRKGTYKGRGILILLLATQKGDASLSLEVTTGRGRGLYTVSTRRETLASLSLSSIDNSHASMMSHLGSPKSNIRLSSVSLLIALALPHH